MNVWKGFKSRWMYLSLLMTSWIFVWLVVVSLSQAPFVWRAPNASVPFQKWYVLDSGELLALRKRQNLLRTILTEEFSSLEHSRVLEISGGSSRKKLERVCQKVDVQLSLKKSR